jgi:hypothetical protein
MGNLTITPAITMQADRLRFPGMLPREILIFKNWLTAHEAEYDSFDYNKRIGAGQDPGPTWPDYVRQCAIANTQLRIDAVAYKAGVPTLIEVKDRAGASALGQILTYEAVWLKDYPQGPAPLLILVTNRIQLNMGPLIQKSGVRLDVVPTDFSSLKPGLYAPGYTKPALKT